MGTTKSKARTIMQGRTMRLPKDEFEPFTIEKVDEDIFLWNDSDFEISESDEAPEDGNLLDVKSIKEKRRKSSIFVRKDSFDEADKRAAKLEKEKKKKQSLHFSAREEDIEEAKEHNENLYFKEKEMATDAEVAE